MDTNAAQPRIADYLKPLASRWWMILVAVVVATGAVYAYYAHKPNVYSASTLVYYQDPGDPVTGTPSLPSTDRTIANEATLLDSRQNASAVAAQVGYHGTPAQLLQQVSITSKQGQDFIEVSADAGSPKLAAAIANRFAGNLVTLLAGGVKLRIADALKLSQTQLSQLPQNPGTAPQRATLADQVNRLQLALRVPTTVASQVDPALPPASPTSPKPSRNALFAFILSLLGAIALAYGIERFDRRLKNPEDMERAYGRSLLAVLPHTTEPSPVRSGEAALSFEFREPFRVLRANVELESLDAPPRTIVVSSAMPGEGKSTVARNLALAFRESGKTVAAVDLDLRHPSLGALFGVTSGPGVTEVLRHDVELAEALIPVPVKLLTFDDFMRVGPSARANGAGANGTNGHGHHPEISLLPSGAPPANPAGVLGSERLIEVLEELRAEHDIVIIDSAPTLAVSDTIPLLRNADAALFVGRLDITTRDTAKRLMEYLERIPDLRLLGVVANDLSRLEASGYGYGYGYGAYSEGRRPGRSPLVRGRGRSKQPA